MKVRKDDGLHKNKNKEANPKHIVHTYRRKEQTERDDEKRRGQHKTKGEKGERDRCVDSNTVSMSNHSGIRH